MTVSGRVSRLAIRADDKVLAVHGAVSLNLCNVESIRFTCVGQWTPSRCNNIKPE